MAEPNSYDGCYLELGDCEATILAEVADKAVTRASVAMTYALTLRSSERTRVDWAKVNRAIQQRWSRSALEWIKREAHKRAPMHTWHRGAAADASLPR